MEEQKDATWADNINVERFLETLVKLIEEERNIKIKCKIRKKTEEELNSEEMRNRLFVFNDEE
jgi:hypothetical protein